MRCTICGTLLPNLARFCGQCGAPLIAQSASPAGPSVAPTPSAMPTPGIEDLPTEPLTLADLVGADDGESGAAPPWLVLRSALRDSGIWPAGPVDDGPPEPEPRDTRRLTWRGLAHVVRESLVSAWEHDRPFVVAAGVALALLAAACLAWAVDWGSGLLLLGALAVAAGAAIAAVVGIRTPRQRHVSQPGAQPWMLLLAAALVMFGGVAVLLVSPVRVGEAQRLEAAGRYAQAATLYARAGEQAPDGRDLARALVEDGAARARRGDFAGAARTLQRVADHFPRTREGASARSLLAQVELGWGELLQARGDYTGAAVHLAAVLARYGGTTAAVRARPMLAQVLLRGALTAQAHQDYDRAEADLRAVTQRFADLPEAGQARQVLTAGQTVTGRLLHANGTPVAGATVLLAAGWTLDPTTRALATNGHRYTATSDAGGRFAVPGVPPNMTYALVWDSGAGETSVIDPTRDVPVYMVSVQPLRLADMGDVVIA